MARLIFDGTHFRPRAASRTFGHNVIINMPRDPKNPPWAKANEQRERANECLCYLHVGPRIIPDETVSDICVDCKKKLDAMVDAAADSRNGDLPQGMTRTTRANENPRNLRLVRRRSLGERTEPLGPVINKKH